MAVPGGFGITTKLADEKFLPSLSAFLSPSPFFAVKGVRMDMCTRVCVCMRAHCDTQTQEQAACKLVFCEGVLRSRPFLIILHFSKRKFFRACKFFKYVGYKK